MPTSRAATRRCAIRPGSISAGDHAHHRGLAAGPEGRAGGGGLLDGDQPVDDPAALLRADIDRIDSAMHDLLMERGRIIDRLIAVKKTSASIRRSCIAESMRSMSARRAARSVGGGDVMASRDEASTDERGRASLSRRQSTEERSPEARTMPALVRGRG
jgi:hypothetical protein